MSLNDRYHDLLIKNETNIVDYIQNMLIKLRVKNMMVNIPSIILVKSIYLQPVIMLQIQPFLRSSHYHRKFKITYKLGHNIYLNVRKHSII